MAKRWNKVPSGEVLGADPMHQKIDTGREFMFPPNVLMDEAEAARGESIAEIFAKISPEAFEAAIREAASQSSIDS